MLKCRNIWGHVGLESALGFCYVICFLSVREVEVAYGKNENSGKPLAFGEHSQRFKPEEAPTLLTGSGPTASAAEKPTEV